NCYLCIRFNLLPIYRLDSSCGLGAFHATLKVSEIIGDGVFLPVTIRGEMSGRTMRGGATSQAFHVRPLP
ncbi:hypothetical protein, partial [Mesorhizobium sp.]|uniref:hypothetical protein n=1 Tax=Mesorhizobium sp. TaxID=1871066 RepID=UPI0025D8DD41